MCLSLLLDSSEAKEREGGLEVFGQDRRTRERPSERAGWLLAAACSVVVEVHQRELVVTCMRMYE